MLSIRETISRVGRSVRQIESFGKNSPIVAKKLKAPRKVPSTKPTTIPSGSTPIQKYQTKLYQDFLEPLELPDLKIFNDTLPKYDQDLATTNWQRKTGKQPIDVFFLQDRLYFEKMMESLVAMTPRHLLGNENKGSVAHVLQQHAEQHPTARYQSKYSRHSFEEIPPMPNPLTKDSFQEYIYMLTHQTFHYRNSLSLGTGLVPDILLYTHKLTNHEFKHLRTVHTYNYLIKFFGYDKNQSSFARELLLVMNKDGHKPNIDTINNLLKLCLIHSHIRSTTNTYQIVLKYLKLAKTMGIEINLSTYTRVYDAIGNIFLREKFLNKVQEMGLLVLRNLVIKIMDDFATATHDTTELVRFIADDLGQHEWMHDSKLLNKVVLHRAKNVTEDDLGKLWTFLSARLVAIDEYTVKLAVEGIRQNRHISSANRWWIVLIFFHGLRSQIVQMDMSKVVRVYRDVIEELVSASDIFPGHEQKVALMVRGTIADAKLDLLDEELSSEVTEGYKILRRIVGALFDRLEAKIAYRIKQGFPISRLSDGLDAEEQSQWTMLKTEFAEGLEGSPEAGGISPTQTFAPPKLITKIKETFAKNIENAAIDEAYVEAFVARRTKTFINATNNVRSYKLDNIDRHIHTEMMSRHII